jgi:hypothetical protein
MMQIINHKSVAWNWMERSRPYGTTSAASWLGWCCVVDFPEHFQQRLRHRPLLQQIFPEAVYRAFDKSVQGRSLCGVDALPGALTQGSRACGGKEKGPAKPSRSASHMIGSLPKLDASINGFASSI